MRSSISLCGVTRGKGLEVELVPMKCVRLDDYWESSSQWWEIESSGGWVQPTNWYKTLMRRWLSYPKNIQLGVWFVSMSGDKWPSKKCNNAFDVNWANIQRSLLGGSGPITTRSGRLQSNVSGWGLVTSYNWGRCGECHTVHDRLAIFWLVDPVIGQS